MASPWKCWSSVTISSKCARYSTQIYTMIRPAQLKQAVSFYEEPARRMLENVGSVRKSMFEEHVNVPQTRSEFP